MFDRLGHLIARTAWLWVVFWIGLIAVLSAVAPPWDQVTKSGEFAFLPPEAPTRIAEDRFAETFPDEVLGSSIVIVVHRPEQNELSPADRSFVQQDLIPSLQQTLKLPSADQSPPDDEGQSSANLVADLRSPQDEHIGALLTSDKGAAWLIIVELTSEFLDSRNRPVVGQVQDIVQELRRQQRIPAGLEIDLTGSAVVGRDIGQAKSDSADATKFWTITLVVVLLILVYRAPLLAALPLVTLYTGFTVALETLALAAAADWFDLFRGIEVYTMVVVYGAGVDYSLFLTSRVHEELQQGADPKTAVATSINKVGAAVAASAATEIFGIAMLTFASFGKLHQAGITISFGLAVMLLASLTLTPAILRLTSPWIFWPSLRKRSLPAEATAADGTDGSADKPGLLQRFWDRIGLAVERRPGTIFIVAVLVMSVPAAAGIYWYDRLSYGLIAQLPETAPSVTGTSTLMQYFPAGQTGPVTVLIDSPATDFSEAQGISQIDSLSEQLAERSEELQIADIRSVANPLGLGHSAAQPTDTASGSNPLLKIARRAQGQRESVDHYVSDSGEGRSVTRLDVILETDPFARDSIAALDQLQRAIQAELPDTLSQATVHLIGPTASIRDLKNVAAEDRIRINLLVTAAVLAVLLLLLRRLVLTVYLLGSVIFSYLAALGLTFAVFQARASGDFPGLDWTVPLFLFTILIAVGVDYNIFLVSRVDEESRQHGQVRGIRVALTRTGAIISSCGIIMAGTFSSLAVGGELSRMTQLGFALATGITLDTFLVRPILLPCFMLLVARWREQPHSSESQ